MAVKWLNDDEMLAWRSFIETTGDLLRAIERELAPFGLDRGDYQLLAMLSEAEDGQLRLCDLADSLRLSPSGLTRRMEGVVKKKFVTKTRSAEDRRVTYAQITPKGWEILRKAAPHHLRSVRSLMIDHLTQAEVKALGSAFTKIEAHLNSQH